MAAALALAIESLVFVGVHAQYHGVGSIVMVCVLGLLMALVRVRPDGPVAAPVAGWAPAMRVILPETLRCVGLERVKQGLREKGRALRRGLPFDQNA